MTLSPARRATLLGTVLCVVLALLGVTSSPARALPGWRDNFDRLDPAFWNVTRWGCKSADNVTVSGGMLRLTSSPSPTPDCPVIGGRVDTVGKRTFAPGTYTARIRFDLAPGSWQTFWLTGDSGLPSPANGEIDVAEILGRTPGTHHLRLHSVYPDGRTRADGRPAKCTYKADPALAIRGQWHTYAVTTTPDRATFAVDGRTVATFRRDGRCTWPYTDPMRIILGSGGGGNFGGTVKPDRYPVTVLVDWVSWQPLPR